MGLERLEARGLQTERKQEYVCRMGGSPKAQQKHLQDSKEVLLMYEEALGEDESMRQLDRLEMSSHTTYY